jgi:UDP-N-acetylenolpyruvoylglucosamine reductase
VQDKDSLARSVSGPVFLPDDDGYLEEGATFNLAVSHRPAVIVGATCAADVQAAVRFAAEHDLAVAVLLTGHGPSRAIDDSALLVTTRRMTGLAIDPARRTANVGAGVRWQQVVDEAAKSGLAPLTGSSPGVGVVGYSLGGGLSITMARSLGWAADYVNWIDVVTADGELRRVSDEREPDLFWALRGGKGNYGVVTAMEFSLFPVTTLFAGSISYSGEYAREVLRAYRELSAQAPDLLTSSIALLRMPDLPFIPEYLRGRLSLDIRISYAGPGSEGEELIRPLRAVVPTLRDTVGTIPYGDYSSIIPDAGEPGVGIEHFAMLRELSLGGIDALVEAINSDENSRVNIVDIRQLGGALNMMHENRGAIGNSDALFAIFVLSFVAPEEAAESAGSGLGVMDRLLPWIHDRKHPGFLSPADATVGGTQKAYDRPTYSRLQSIKAAYDPTNMFRFNHNIPPS